MVIADKKIKKAVKKGDIVIEPYDEARIGTNSYDVTLGPVLAIYTDKILDVKRPPNVKYFDIPDDGFVLQPNELYLGSINEYIESPKYLPWIDGRSSAARLGIGIHITAGRGDVGYKGYFTLEITAIKPIRIYKDIRIGQLTFFKTTKPKVLYCDKPNANYSDFSKLPVPSKMWKTYAPKKSSITYTDISTDKKSNNGKFSI
jgi:dCTP deaminase